MMSPENRFKKFPEREAKTWSEFFCLFIFSLFKKTFIYLFFDGNDQTETRTTDEVRDKRRKRTAGVIL